MALILDRPDAAAHRGAPARQGVAAHSAFCCCAAESPEAAPNLARRNPRGYRDGYLWIESRIIDNTTQVMVTSDSSTITNLVR